MSAYAVIVIFVSGVCLGAGLIGMIFDRERKP